MVRIAHISDTHLGARFRRGVRHNVWGVEMRTRLLENDFYERFAEVFDKIAELDQPVDLVVHSGDLYDSPWENNPQQPPVVAQETAIYVLKDFIQKTGIPVLILEGNHGLYRLLDVSLLDSLKMSVPGLDVATQVDLKKAFGNGNPLKYSYDSLDVFCFPFLEMTVLESSNLVPDFNDWITTHQKPDPKRPSIALIHGMTLDRTLFPQIFSMGYDYIALGHDHHQHKHAENAWYAGSIERWRFDEVKHKKGYLLIEIDDDQEVTITPQHLEYSRQVFNESIPVDKDDSVDSVMFKVKKWFEDSGLVSEWNPKTAARVRLSFEGASTKVGGLELEIALEALRNEMLTLDSDYNVAQFVWSLKRADVEFDAAAYPEIESEYLIEDPEKDFRGYLETLDIDEHYDPDVLTRVAVKALKIAASMGDEKLNMERYQEDEPQ